MQDFFPGVASLPVSISPTYASLPEFGEFFHNAINGVCLGIVAVDNQSDFLFRIHAREYMKKFVGMAQFGSKNGFYGKRKGLWA
jgi:hypothetical protein